MSLARDVEGPSRLPHLISEAGAEELSEIRIGVIARELLGGETVYETRTLVDVADVTKVAGVVRVRDRASRVLPIRFDASLCLAVIEAAAPVRGETKTRPKLPRQPRAERDSLHAIEADEIADPPRGQGRPSCATQCLLAYERPRFGLDAANFVSRDRANVRRKRIENARTRPCMRSSHRKGRFRDLWSDEEGWLQAGVELVVVDLPAAADDSAYRIIEPRRRAPDLDLLTSWQPESAPDDSVLENDEQVLELLVEVSGSCKTERHAHDLRIVSVQVQRTDDARLPIVLRSNLDLVHADDAPRRRHPQRIGEREIVLRQTLRRERVRHVLHFVSLADANDEIGRAHV